MLNVIYYILTNPTNIFALKPSPPPEAADLESKAGEMNILETLISDLQYGMRQIRKSPVVAAMAICTLALGIGVNTAIFTLVHAVLLRSLPVPRPAELYSLGDTHLCCDTTDVQTNVALYSYALYREVRDQAREFREVAAFQSWLTNLSVRPVGAGPAEAHKGQFVSGNYFSAFEVSPIVGRAKRATRRSDELQRVAAAFRQRSFGRG